MLCCFGGNSLEGLVLMLDAKVVYMRFSYFLYSVALQEMHDFLMQFVEDFVW